jgi:hypothetical protein
MGMCKTPSNDTRFHWCDDGFGEIGEHHHAAGLMYTWSVV